MLKTVLLPAAISLGACGAVDLCVTPEGGLSFGGGGLSVAAYRPGWSGFKIKTDWKSSSGNARRFTVWNGATRVFDGQGEWTMRGDGTVRGTVSLACAAPAEAQCIALAASIPAVPASGLGDGTARDYVLPVDGRRNVRLRFDTTVRYHAQDSRRWGKAWSVRFGEWQGRRTYAVGDRLEWNVTISSPDGLSLSTEPCAIAEGEDWVRVQCRKDVVPGSALDFSGMGLQDAPAGKHGWLKAVGGRFEFEGLPGAEQRFYGVNLCFTANYPDHATADMLADRLVRCGYNTIRVHHHDGAWAASTENREKLDYLVAKCIARGIYITTDLYVSRPVKWRDVGIDRDGEMNKQLYKTYVGIHEPAFSNWCVHAKAFLEHVNPYTGRAYKDEPGMPLVSLINEGHLGMGWKESGKADDPLLAAAWREFGGKGEVPVPWVAGGGFDEWINAKVWTRCGAFVRSLGAKALLTNDNNGRRHGEGEGLTPRYDYVDNHFYVDHPNFLDERWRLPSRCENRNPIRAGQPRIFGNGWAKGASKPYTITEWNFSGPGRYRGMGGILTGARAAEQEWDGLWRFAYSHSSANLKDNPKSGPGYFDGATDPLIAASDRASVCLYLRRDAGDGALVLDRERGMMVIVTSRTCGGFTEDRPVDAGALSFSVSTNSVSRGVVPTTLWVSSLDGKPIRESSRMLLTHLTDVQGAGTLFADDARTILLKWGRGCLVEAGVAAVSLCLAKPEAVGVWGLDTAGRRQERIPVRVGGGALRFEVSSGSPRGGRIYYELATR